MCDYSLMALPNRLAREGEELVVHRFACGTMGFVSAVDLPPTLNLLTVRLRNIWSDLWGVRNPPKSQSVVAVCIPPGASLRVWDIPEYLQREIDVRRTEEVTFTQITASPFRYRDAIRFRNGRQILLQRLEEGCLRAMREGARPQASMYVTMPMPRSLPRPAASSRRAGKLDQRETSSAFVKVAS